MKEGQKSLKLPIPMSQTEHKRILVTGGAGFIGSNLVHRLVQDGHEVIVMDTLDRGNKIDRKTLENVRLEKADVRDKEAVIECSQGCDIIYHFAAVLGVDVVADNPVETMEVEAKGMMNITEAGLLHGIEKLIYASTSGVYGHSAIEESVKEDIQLDPRTSYAIAKRYNEIYLAGMYEEKSLPSISLRFFNVYGENQDDRMVVPRFFDQAVKGEPITVFGDGRQTRDFTWIEDCVEACVRVMDKQLGCDIFNVSHEKELCIQDLAESIKKVSGSSSEISYIEAPKKRYDYEVERRVGSSEKLFKATGFKPQTSLEEGLRRIYERVYARETQR
jgi:UDP-glucose 4-epimerase